MKSSLHQAVFPKKHGAALRKAAPFVNEVYEGYYADTPLPPAAWGERSVKAGKLLGLWSYHTIPHPYRRLRLAALASYALAWLILYPLPTKLATLALASAYSFIETAFTYYERGSPYTSLGQFGANLLYLPVLLYGYASLVPRSNAAVYVGLFPLNIWALELAEEWFILRPVYGRNVAWTYRDYADEALGGCIRLGHGPCWWALGAALLVVQPHVDSTSEAAAEALLSLLFFTPPR